MIEKGVMLGKGVMSERCIEFSFEEIEAFTCDFLPALFIAEGGFGKVYQGFINSVSSEPDAAVKRLNKTSKQGKGEFEMEVKTLSKIHHPNLVKLIGYCRDKDEMVLVYEYLSKGTLADHLYNKPSGARLSWMERLKICIGAARGLAHLHEEVVPNIIHRDVKATNILLDGNKEAKVADFGLSKFCPMSESQSHVSTDVKGTRGYLDPAYCNSGRLTKKSDVYALGVVFLQVICGRPALDYTLVPEQQHLPEWVQACSDKGTDEMVVDPSLKGQISNDGFRMFIELALKCLVKHPEQRPDMIQVLQTLELVLEMEAQFTPPAGKVRHRGLTRCVRLPTDTQFRNGEENKAALKRSARIDKKTCDDWSNNNKFDDIGGMQGLEDPDQREEGSPIQPKMVLTGNEYGETPVHPPLRRPTTRRSFFDKMKSCGRR